MTDARVSRYLSLCGVLAPPIIVSIIIVAGFLTPGYSHLSDTISQLSAQGRPHPEIMNAGFIIYGVFIIGFSYALYRQLGRGTTARIVWLMLTIYSVGVILSGIFQDNYKASGTVNNLESNLHNVIAFIAFIALIIGIWMFARRVHGNPLWHGFTWFSVAIALFNLTSSLIFVTEAFVPIEGLLQRFFYITSLVWVEAVSVRLFRLSGD